MGVPLNPVLIVRKMSSRDEPPRRVQLCARSAGAYRMVPVVHQGWSRRSVAPAERAVALDAAGVHVELLPELDRLLRGSRRARERHRLGDFFLVREVGGERRNEVREIRHFLVGECGPGGHRGVRHAAPDDVDEVLMRRERSVGSRPDLELARREVAGPRAQMRGGISFTVTFLAVALRAVLEIELLARLPLRLGSDVWSRRARRSRRRETQRGDQHRETPAPETSADRSGGRSFRALFLCAGPERR